MIRPRIAADVKAVAIALAAANPGLSSRKLSALILERHGLVVSPWAFDRLRRAAGSSRGRHDHCRKPPLSPQQRDMIGDPSVFRDTRKHARLLAWRYGVDRDDAESRAMYSLTLSVRRYFELGCPGEYRSFAARNVFRAVRSLRRDDDRRGMDRAFPNLAPVPLDSATSREMTPPDAAVFRESLREALSILEFAS